VASLEGDNEVAFYYLSAFIMYYYYCTKLLKTLRFSLQPIKSEQAYEGDDKWKVVSYEKTPIMSTYLLAYIVGEFDYVEGKDADGVLIRVYTPVGKKEQGKFALDVRSLCIYILHVSYFLSGYSQTFM